MTRRNENGLVRTAETPSEPAAGTSRAAVRSSTLLFSGQMFATVVNLLAQVLIVRALSRAGFGAFAYALAVAAIAESVAAFGLRRGISRFVPIYEERGEHDRAAGTLVFAVAVVLAFGAVVVVAVITARDVLVAELPPREHAARLVAILILLAPIQALQALLDAAFAAFDRPRAIFVRGYLYTPLLRLGLAVAVAVGGFGTTFLAVGYVAAGAIGVAFYAVFFAAVARRRALGGYVRPARFSVPAREILRFTTPLLSNDVAGALLNALGVVLLGLLAGTGEVADLRAVLPISLTLTYVLAAFGTMFTPLASRLYARGDSAGLDRLYWQTAAWSAVLSFPLFALAFAFAKPLVLLLFGDRYAEAANVLAALVAGHFVTAALGPNGVLLGVYAETRYIVATNIAAIAVNVGLSLALIPSLGAFGAAIAASATIVLMNVARQVGLATRTAVRAVAGEYARFFIVVAALTAVLLLIDAAAAPSLPVALLLVGLASFAAFAYARRQLDVAGTFPELGRLPGIGRFFAAPAERP